MTNPNTPIIVGVAQVLNRVQTLEDAVEPLAMMLQAAELAEQDTGVGGLLAQVQSVRVIRGVWNYANPAKHIAAKIGAPSAQSVGTLFGGNQNQVIVNRTALSILSGELDLVLITGAEYGKSAGKARKAGKKIPLTETPGEYDLIIGAQKPEHHDCEIAKGIRTAIQVYPMYDNAIRHHRSETIDAHLLRVSELWSRFNDVAQTNPHAWIRENVTAEEIRTPSPTNRRISFPYTKLMNANMSVDMGAALIMCSVGKARKLGIAERLWVYPYAGAEGYDHFSASVRDNFYSSPGIGIVGRTVLALAETEIDALPARECLGEYRGDATVESYTVMFSDEEPAIAHVACLTPQGQRVWVNSQDQQLMAAMISEEFCGRRAYVDSNGKLQDRFSIRD